MSSTRSQRTRRATGTEQDYYALLGVPYSATFQEITRAYRDKMKGAHPDRQRPDRRAAAEERAKLLNLAFATLSKAESRRKYDTEIKAAAVQDQIMNRYVGGFSPSGATSDPFGEALRRERSQTERAEARHADRSATATVFITFGGIALLVILLLLVWAVLDALFGALL